MREPEGFAAFVAARSPALIRTAWLLTGSSAAAEDLVQEALARTWRVWESIERHDAPEAYVRRVMVNTYTSWTRRRWRGEVPTDVLPEPRPAGGPYDETAALDVAYGVRLALAELPPRQRAVLVLRYYDDLTEAQIADVLGCAVGTVKSQASRALAALRASRHVQDAPTGGDA